MYILDKTISGNLQVIRLGTRNNQKFYHYLMHEINDMLSDPMKLNKARIDMIFEKIPFSWDLLNHYYHNHKNYLDIIGKYLNFFYYYGFLLFMKVSLKIGNKNKFLKNGS